MKINLGCGHEYLEGFINCDISKKFKADLHFDMELTDWPIKSDTVKEIYAFHVLEHLSSTGYLNAWQEMYRICKHNAIVSVRFPHHLHDHFYSDPTHKTAITMGGLKLFNKKRNLELLEQGYSNSPLALEFNIDFRIIKASCLINPLFENTLEQSVKDNILESTLVNVNVIEEVIVDLQVYKPKTKKHQG